MDSLCGVNETRPLLLYGSDAGLGNRFGALLAGAAIGGVLGRPVSMKWTPKNMYDRSQNRSSGSATSLLELMNLPSAVQVLDSLPHTQSRSARDHARRNKDPQAEIIWDARERFGPKFVFPEPSFEIYARVLPHLRRCSSKQGYLAAYRKAQAQLRVRYEPVILCEADGGSRNGSSPTSHSTGDMNGDRDGDDEAAVTVAPRRYVAVAPRQYMALHVRRGDRGRWKSPDTTNDTIASIMVLSATGLKLPWLVVSDSVDAAQTFRRALRQRAGLRVCVVRGRGQGRGDLDLASRDAIFRATIDDFGALQAAAGVITDVSSWGTWIESSFSTVAALSGATPLLYPWNSSTRMTVCRYCRTNASRKEKLLTPVEAEVEFNNGEPMSGIFFLDSLEAFRSAVLTAGGSRVTVRPFVRRLGGAV